MAFLETANLSNAASFLFFFTDRVGEPGTDPDPGGLRELNSSDEEDNFIYFPLRPFAGAFFQEAL